MCGWRQEVAEAFERLIDECGVQPFPRGSHRLLRLRENQAGTFWGDIAYEKWIQPD